MRFIGYAADVQRWHLFSLYAAAYHSPPCWSPLWSRENIRCHCHRITGAGTLLASWSRVLLEKLTGLQLVKNFLAFYGTRRFITAFTSARHLSLSWTSSIQYINRHLTSWRPILILYSHLRLGLPSGLFPSGFLTKPLYKPLPSPCALHVPPISFFSILSPAQYWVSSTNH